VFYLLWVLIGVSMAGVLYEPAFAVITAVFGPDARRGITALTLVGGFASTVFMPLTQLLIGAVGWRNTLLVLGGLNLAVCLPLHALFVPASPASRLPEAPQADAPTAHAWARRGIVEPALRALLCVDQHPATLARDKHFNATRLAPWRETLGPAIIAAAAAWGKTKQLDEVVTWIDNNAGYGACASGTI
jgi:MFS family permease